MKEFPRLKGKAILLNINEKNIRKLPSSDICFLFKILELLEKKGHKFSELLITNLRCKYVIVSFSTRTVSNKKMNFPRRGWIERMLKRLNYEFKIIKVPNEIFYLIKK